MSFYTLINFSVRILGIEPRSPPWQGGVLPLNHIRVCAIIPCGAQLANYLFVQTFGRRKLDDVCNCRSLSVGPQCASRGDNERREGYPPRSPALCCEEPKCAEKYERDSDEGARQVHVALSEWGLRDSGCRT